MDSSSLLTPKMHLCSQAGNLGSDRGRGHGPGPLVSVCGGGQTNQTHRPRQTAINLTRTLYPSSDRQPGEKPTEDSATMDPIVTSRSRLLTETDQDTHITKCQFPPPLLRCHGNGDLSQMELAFYMRCSRRGYLLVKLCSTSSFDSGSRFIPSGQYPRAQK